MLNFAEEAQSLFRNRLLRTIGSSSIIIFFFFITLPADYSTKDILHSFSRIIQFETDGDPIKFKFSEVVPVTQHNNHTYFLGKIDQEYYLVKASQKNLFCLKPLNMPLNPASLSADEIVLIGKYLQEHYPEGYIGDNDNIIDSFKRGRYSH